MDFVGRVLELLPPERLFARQLEVVSRFDSLSGFGGSDGRAFSSALDRYLLHTIEEVAEFYSGTYADFSEYCDVLNYVGSVGAVLSAAAAMAGVPFPVHPPSSLPGARSRGNAHSLALEVVEHLVWIRRQVPHRKWHVPCPPSLDVAAAMPEMCSRVYRAVYRLLDMGAVLNYNADSLVAVSGAKTKTIIARADRAAVSKQF
jgi:hypothetical protein